MDSPIKSELLDSLTGIRYFFGTKVTPKPGSGLLSLPQWKQVHGTKMAHVTSAGQPCGEVDALFTDRPGLPIAVVTADCAPILAVKAGKTGGSRAVLVIHAGWRGTLDGILEKSFSGLDPSEWMAVIGPSIQACCFEVGPEVEHPFLERFSYFDSALVRPSPRHLSLSTLQGLEIKRLGLNAIEVQPHCTRCQQSPPFFSHRREPGLGRQLSLLELNT